MNIPHEENPSKPKSIIKRYTKELLIALVLAIVAAIGFERWEGWSYQKAINNNLNAVATIVVYDRAGRPISQGSGFFINSSGLLITNAHVIRDMGSAHAKLKSGAYYELQSLKSINSDLDIAVLQFDANETPCVKGLGNSDEVVPGEKVFAIGTPVGQEGTVSEGNISNPTRDVGGRRFLQFTAPISPGSSGGGLFEKTGYIIGVTTASLNIQEGEQAGSAQNINFAIPINELKKSFDETPKSTDAASYYFKGTLAENRKEWNDAIRYFSRAVELDSLNADAYIGLGSCYFAKRDYKHEYESYLAATLADPNNSEAFYYYATSCEDYGQYKEAGRAFLKSYTLDPEDKDVIHDFALYYLAVGDKEDAATLINKLSGLDPGWGAVLKSILQKSK